MRFMRSFRSILKSIGTATAANLIGRAANVLIALSVITLCGANAWTDQYFLIMAIAFFFFGAVANAVTTATTPMLISARLTLTPSSIGIAGAFCTMVIWLAGLTWRLVVGPVPVSYIFAVGLLAGAGIANGFCTGIHYAAERYLAPGLTWALRLIPLTIFILAAPQASKLSGLAIGIGLTDWARFALLLRRSGPHARGGVGRPLKSLATAFPTYAKVIAASVIMGLNPIIDRMIAELSGPGSVSILESGERIYLMLASLSTIGIMAVLLTHLSREVASDQLETNWPRTIRLAAAWSGFWILVGFGIGFWALTAWLNGFTPLAAEDCRTAQWVYWYYLAGLPAFAIGITYVKRLQALQRWSIMVGTSLFSVTANIPASLILRHWMGIPGIALATTLIGCVNCAVLITAAHARRYQSATS